MGPRRNRWREYWTSFLIHITLGELWKVNSALQQTRHLRHWHLPFAGRRKSSSNKKIKVGSSGESKKKPKLSSGEETASDEESENEEADEEEGGQDVDSEIEEEKQEEYQVEVDRIETKEEVKQKSKVHVKLVNDNSMRLSY